MSLDPGAAELFGGATTSTGRDAAAGRRAADRISDAYTGAPFPMRSGVVFVVSAQASGFGELPFRHDPA